MVPDHEVTHSNEGASMYVTDQAEIVIDATPEAIWEYVTDPVHWTASNPEEHYGLEYDTPDNRPREGATFHQREEVAGMYADLYGRFPYIDYPSIAVWAGTAYYPLLWGLLTVRIPDGGTLRLEETDEGTRMSHAVWMHFPNSRRGRVLKWVFTNVLDGPAKLYNHTNKELVFFKERLESEASTPTA